MAFFDQTASTQPEAILVIDSDSVILDLLRYNLATSFSVDVCSNASEALELDLTRYNLLILDIDLDGKINGLELIEMLRRNPATAWIPFILCTARDSEDDIIRGFDAGADDYIVKPFSLREMVARVKSVTRRHALTRPKPRPAAVPTVVELPGITINTETQRVEVDGETVTFSRTEFQILSLMVKNPGRLFSRGEIARHAWSDAESVSSRTIDVNISRIRKKLGPQASRIKSLPGQGYGID